MNQDYRVLTPEQHDLLEKQTMRMVVQALQEYSREAKDIFEGAPASTKDEVTVLAEDLVQYALEVAECYPINKRFAGSIDYKRVRWLPTPFGLIPQALLVDAKASTEGYRTTLQKSQLGMDAEFLSRGEEKRLGAGAPEHLVIHTVSGDMLYAVSTSLFVHFHYTELQTEEAPYRNLRAIFVIAVPHQRLKHMYNPDAAHSFFGQGKHSPARDEDPRIRVYFPKLRAMCPWRLQELHYAPDTDFTKPVWRDGQTAANEVEVSFQFIGR